MLFQKPARHIGEQLLAASALGALATVFGAWINPFDNLGEPSPRGFARGNQIYRIDLGDHPARRVAMSGVAGDKDIGFIAAICYPDAKSRHE